MQHHTANGKIKILNDPVYGFIHIPDQLLFDLMEHPWFQRLRRIKQLGLTHLVYPGALHTRFHHALGAMHLMQKALDVLHTKGVIISHEEQLAALVAILLHDIGHGPYSHTLEKVLIENVTHEDLTLAFMHHLSKTYGHILPIASKIFKGEHSKDFLTQLVSGQLDTDRLDFLNRDSFYTGVAEGVINSDRIIAMMNVFNNQLVIEAKGIYSIEKFIVARRLMYWQVYLHKTVISAEQMLLQILRRAKLLTQEGVNLFASDPFKMILKNSYTLREFDENEELIEIFAQLDDYDIFSSIKEWAKSNDKILSYLCYSLVNRKLFRTEIRNEPVTSDEIESLKQEVMSHYSLSKAETEYFVVSGTARNSAYDPASPGIGIYFRNGEVKDLSEVSDQLTAETLARTVNKYFLCYPKF